MSEVKKVEIDNCLLCGGLYEIGYVLAPSSAFFKLKLQWYEGEIGFWLNFTEPSDQIGKLSVSGAYLRRQALPEMQTNYARLLKHGC